MPWAENESKMMGERIHFFDSEKQVEQTHFFDNESKNVSGQQSVVCYIVHVCGTYYAKLCTIQNREAAITKNVWSHGKYIYVEI